MKLQEFDYKLPSKLIAQTPSRTRDESRLMVVFRGEEKIIHSRFKYLPDFVNENEIIVLNESKVIPARLIARKKPTGAKIEILVYRSVDINKGIYQVIAKPLKRLHVGTCIEIASGFETQVMFKEKEYCLMKFSPPHKFNDMLEKYGKPPLPPYITTENYFDRERYQTVYASIPGSIAAPTAGMHFTHRILDKLRKKGLDVEKLVLHVGPGTFKPLRGNIVEEQTLEPEDYILPGKTANKINIVKQSGNKLIAVGTTTIRVLESCASSKGILSENKGSTSLFIYPGYKFKVVDAILTNFHLPKSSLLLLVCAFAGKDLVMHAYKTAIEEGYRFYSYGDAMLIR